MGEAQRQWRSRACTRPWCAGCEGARLRRAHWIPAEQPPPPASRQSLRLARQEYLNVPRAHVPVIQHLHGALCQLLWELHKLCTRKAAVSASSKRFWGAGAHWYSHSGPNERAELAHRFPTLAPVRVEGEEHSEHRQRSAWRSREPLCHLLLSGSEGQAAQPRVGRSGGHLRQRTGRACGSLFAPSTARQHPDPKIKVLPLASLPAKCGGLVPAICG
eukprot:scaffold5935_cov137-Isochrysis_galbana.AAC.3